MKTDVKPIRKKKDYEVALKEIEKLWGAKSSTPEGDRLDVLVTIKGANVHAKRSFARS